VNTINKNLKIKGNINYFNEKQDAFSNLNVEFFQPNNIVTQDINEEKMEEVSFFGKIYKSEYSTPIFVTNDWINYNSKLRSNNQAPNSNVLAIDKVSGFYQSVFPYTNTSVK
jgi:hypothetical protein